MAGGSASCSLDITCADLCEEQLSKATHVSALEACSEWKTQCGGRFPQDIQTERVDHKKENVIECARSQRVEDVMGRMVVKVTILQCTLA